MSDAATAENDPIAMRDEDAFDIAAVDAQLKEHIPGLTGTPSVAQFSSGASNLTYALDYPDRRLVLRRPPMGKKPASGHSMIREYRVMKALCPVFPQVPEMLFYADDETSPFGAEFYVMARVDGFILGKTIPPAWGWSAEDNERFCRKVWDTMADLHAVDVTAAGLSDFGKPEGYVARQVSGWNRRFEEALTPDVAPFEDVRDWLDANKKPDVGSGALLHGDYRMDNMILNRQDPSQIDAIIDWELAALGDPLMDLGSALAYWIEEADPVPLRALEKQPSRAEGMLTRQQIVDHYTAKTGLKVDDFTFYYVFGLFRLAGIAQQIYYRYYHKQTTNPAFKGLGAAAQGLCLYCQSIIAKGMTR